MQRIMTFVLVLSICMILSLPCYARDERGEAYYDFGVFAFEEGDYKGAHGNFRKAIGFSPDNPFYNHYLGKTLSKMKRFRQAEEHLSRAFEKDPDVPGLKYDLGILYFETGRFSESSKLFTRVSQEEPTNVLAHYHGGISLYKEDRYDEAVVHLNKAAQLSPTALINSYYYMGICYRKAGKNQLAREKFDYVIKNSDSPGLKESAKRWLASSKKGGKAPKDYSLHLKLGYRYDDNVRLEPLDLDFYPDEDDYLTVAFFSGNYNFLSGKKYVVGAGYSHYQTWYSELDEYNMMGSIGSIYGKYLAAPFTYGLTYNPSFYWVDNDDYLDRHRVSPDMLWKVDNNLTTRFSYAYAKEDYSDDDGRDADNHEFLAEGFYSVMENKGRLYGGIGFEFNHANRDDEDYSLWRIKVGGAMDIFWEMEVGATGKYEAKKHDSTDPFYKVIRDDSRYTARIYLSRKLFFDWLGSEGEYSNTKNVSNINDFEYDRNSGTLSLTATY